MSIPTWVLWLLFPVLSIGGFLSAVCVMLEFSQPYMRLKWFPWPAQLWFAVSLLVLALGIACLFEGLWRLFAV